MGQVPEDEVDRCLGKVGQGPDRSLGEGGRGPQGQRLGPDHNLLLLPSERVVESPFNTHTTYM